MIDLHCHILPGVDDGSDSPDASCRMAAAAASCGVRQIVATPHRGIDPKRESGGAERIRAAVRALQRELDRWEIPIVLLPGSELLLRTGQPLPGPDSLLTLNGSRYLLVEFYFDEDPAVMERKPPGWFPSSPIRSATSACRATPPWRICGRKRAAFCRSTRGAFSVPSARAPI